MVDIHAQRGQQGKRSCIVRSHKMAVIDGFFANEVGPVHTTGFMTEYMYGT